MKNIKFYKTILPLVVASTLTLTGCGEELGSDISDYDVLETVNNEEGFTGVEQIVEVPHESFCLRINYTSGEKVWRITSDKELNMEIYTQGLAPNLSVYIDNIHTDTSIISTKAQFDGIKQDSMDDRVHNTQMMGFPISDTIPYYGINEIEGENQDFIQGYFYGCSSSESGQINQKRYLESDFLEDGVWGNRIDSIIDLIVVDNTTGEIRTMSVSSTIIVEANNTITYSDGSIVEYDREGTKYNVSYDENGNKKLSK